MIFLASMVAYLVSQIVDISIFQYAKKLTQSEGTSGCARRARP